MTILSKSATAPCRLAGLYSLLAKQAMHRSRVKVCYTLALHQMFYNFVRMHQTLKITPAMAAGVTDRLWDMTDIVKVLEEWEAEMATAGTTYDIEPDRIGDGVHVRKFTRYGKPERMGSFKTEDEARAAIEANRAKHRPGRRRKIAA